MPPDDVRLARGNAFLRRWLFVMAGLVFGMVVVGGATRLTGSGLSITEWRPIMGAIPPLTAQDWAEAFAKYQAIPQYELLNKGMSFGEFQTIFWWEWSHRQLGRLIGLVTPENIGEMMMIQAARPKHRAGAPWRPDPPRPSV
jgi:cytochrome c oxidase assembly protein subunit 15